MDPYNNLGAPYDPDPEDALPDNQETLNDNYVENAVNDVPENMLDNPEDEPHYYDSDRNPAPESAVGSQNVADKAAERDMEGDVSEDDPDVERRIG